MTGAGSLVPLGGRPPGFRHVVLMVLGVSLLVAAVPAALGIDLVWGPLVTGPGDLAVLKASGVTTSATVLSCRRKLPVPGAPAACQVAIHLGARTLAEGIRGQSQSVANGSMIDSTVDPRDAGRLYPTVDVTGGSTTLFDQSGTFVGLGLLILALGVAFYPARLVATVRRRRRIRPQW